MLTVEQKHAYLARIGMANFDDGAACTWELLDKIILAHLCLVPFETVDINKHTTPLSLATEDLFRKIVADFHGGYCFELNKLFEKLLLAVGFDVRPCLCRSVRGRNPMPVNHRGELVEIDGVLHYADVGFGGPLCSKSVPLEDGKPVFDGMHTFVPVQMEDGWWKLDRFTGGDADIYGDDGETRRQTELLLSTGPAGESDFDDLSAKLSKPGVLFYDHDIVNLRTPDGYTALKDYTLTQRTPEGKRVIEITSEEARADLIERLMGFRPYGV